MLRCDRNEDYCDKTPECCDARTFSQTRSTYFDRFAERHLLDLSPGFAERSSSPKRFLDECALRFKVPVSTSATYRRSVPHTAGAHSDGLQLVGEVELLSNLSGHEMGNTQNQASFPQSRIVRDGWWMIFSRCHAFSGMTQKSGAF